MKQTINFTEPLKEPLKEPLSLWDTLPTEIMKEISDYNKFPYLDDIKKPHNLNKKHYLDGMSPYVWLDHKTSRQINRNLYGDVFFTYYGVIYYPCREDVIKKMKINKLRIRKGMKTRTMIKHLIKL
tara:strand:- start:70 stop:447 length:378 start_codon:yes stop_codon:yes gene_type:complete